ncbi:polysaccharide pyruvyl transferase family protein [Algoriphagus halophytocola]|uniref:polysaccharide pyruvyl transferase family protein n=1 Tax=Algoriphagus halophytocola TaxID=2991499 RepID=UPI0022DE028A|nr:polysaccharide pyruvyl transferase family protein [Algoriphagus sp. TR-M9]WBL44325.1 polysaccharide pyruvyl transferase family protein [Algoriphagus sp. TR-M9]
MIIELRGVEFVNKGAELMLHAIIEELKQRIPEVEFAMEAGSRTPKEKLASNGILMKTNFKKFGFNLSPILNILPKPLLRSKNMVADQEITAVLDGSGFAFGDKWGAKKAGERSANHIRNWKAEGKKVILLPQAFGPFTSQDLVEKMQVILNQADLIFARDEKSLSYLNGLTSNSINLRLAPDFTNLLHPGHSLNNGSYQNRIAIIPNQKMLETDKEDQNHLYPSYLEAVVSILQNRGESPFFLIHESRKDGQISDLVNSKLGNRIDVIREDDPLKVKGIIGASKAVVTSRFHGLVSALSQCVPSLSTGWSHKYQELLKDYDYQEGLCEVSVDENYLESKINLILDPAKREEIIAKLQSNTLIQKERTKEMWYEVTSVLVDK